MSPNIINLISDDEDTIDLTILPAIRPPCASYILAFDVGSVNLAYSCLRVMMDDKPGLIMDCRLVNLEAKPIDTCRIGTNIASLINSLVTKYGKNTIKKVLIEKQIVFKRNASRFSSAPLKNTMIECALHTAFRIHGISTETYLKRDTSHPPGTTYYQKKKMASIELQSQIRASPMLFSANVIEYVNEAKKKDDLSDSILMLFKYMTG